MKKEKLYPDQILPLILTFVVCAFLVLILFLEIVLLNKSAISRIPISTIVRIGEVGVGITIYLKTSIDFAIFIGRLMSEYVGWKNRIMIEIGTAAGNAAGTLGILVVWDLFREVPFLMAIMISLAALVLIRMAEDGLDHAKVSGWVIGFKKVLHTINHITAPLLSRIIPDISFKGKKKVGYKSLFIFAFTIPFILGLDDFAGYIPLFNVINVFGFAIGVFVGHMILNIFLFLSPKKTIQVVENPVISLFGSVAFVGLALWGLYEAIHLFL